MDDITVINSDAGGHDNKVPIVLPCSAENFREFISGLLGQPQEIDGGEFGSFCIDKKQVEQIYHLVSQRVYQQNGVHPIAVSVRIAYDDGTSINLNSFNDFQSYNEPKPVVSTECHITFVYLIKFPTTSAPERQEITVSFVSSQESSRRRHFATFAESPFALFARGYIGYRIKYTARTWGADVESLLKNYIKEQLIEEGQLRKLVRTHSVKFALIIAGGGFAISYFLVTNVYDEVTALYLEELGAIFGNKVTLGDKLDALIRLLVSGNLTTIESIKNGILYGSMLVAIFLAFYIESKADSRRPSFVLLTSKAAAVRDNILKQYEKKIFELVGVVVFSIVVGVTANIVYDYYAKNVMSTVLNNIKSQIKMSASNSVQHIGKP